MANKKVYKSGRKNPNAYNFSLNKKILFYAVVIVLAIILSFALNKKWNSNYKDTGLIQNVPVTDGSELAIYYLDVDQSDCTIICNNNKVLMIDTAMPSETDTVRETLQSLGISKIDYLIITHQHDDHMGGATTILQNYQVDNIIMPKLGESNAVTTQAYVTLLNTIKEKGVKTTAATPGFTFDLGEAKCTLLAPYEQDTNLNNMSVVTKITFGNRSFLFQGDAESKVESQILNKGTDVSADVIKVGHHGSKTSSSAKYIKAVAPKIAIISCGATNTYGHPHSQTLDTLSKNNVDTYITYQTGTITLKCDGNRITIMNNSGVLKTYE